MPARAQDSHAPARVDSLSTVVAHSRFLSNLDSLGKLSYVGRETVSRQRVELPDTLLRRRLQALPTVVPMRPDPLVKAYLSEYLGERRGQTASMLGLARAQEPVFEAAIRAHRLPLELKYLPMALSSLYPFAASEQGAGGVWQLNYTIARMYGLYVDSYVDQRRDPQAASMAAAAYLVELFGIYKDWPLALSAYACGAANVNKAIREAGGQTSFQAIYPHLPEGERDLLPAFVAVTYLAHYHHEHGLEVRGPLAPSNTAVVSVDKDLHFGQVSAVLGVSLPVLRELNPTFRKDVLPGKQQPRGLVLPGQQAQRFAALRDSIYNYQDSSIAQPREVVLAERTEARAVSSSPVASYSGGSSSASATDGKTRLTYTVRSGDNIGLISSWYGVSIAEVRQWNNLNHNGFIRAGQSLSIYVSPSVADRYRAVNTMSFAQKQALAGGGSTASTSRAGTSSTPARASAPTPAGGSDRYVYYTIRPGDNLWDIAQNYPVSSTDIMRLNGFTERDVRDLKVGQVIKIMPKP